MQDFNVTGFSFPSMSIYKLCQKNVDVITLVRFFLWCFTLSLPRK